MYKKKLSTIAIITILTLSILLAAMPMATATITTAPMLYEPGTTTGLTSGPVGTKVQVEGTGAAGTAAPFNTVNVYWEGPTGQLLGTVDADINGLWAVNVTIPPAINGAHYIVAADDGGAYGAAFTVVEEIAVSTTPSTKDFTYAAKVLPGDSLTVDGTGFGKQVKVRIFLGTYGAVTGETFSGDGTTTAFTLANNPVVVGSETVTVDPITGEVIGTGDGAAVTFAATLAVIPVLAGSVSVTDGTETFSDNGDGTLTGDAGGTGTINYATGAISVTFSVAPGAAVSVTADYEQDLTYTINYVTGVITFSDPPYTGVNNISVDYEYADYEVTPTAGVTTDDEGSFPAVITIPAMAETAYGDYLVTAVDADGNQDDALISINYYITVWPPAGPRGITIAMSGRIPANKDYDIRIDGVSIATGTSGADTRFLETYVIPPLISIASHDVQIFWDVVKHADTTFLVTAPPTLTLSALVGVPGAVITISGAGFSGLANITLTIGTTTVNSTAIDSRFGPTGFTGTFSEEFTVPNITPGLYVLTVVDQNGATTGTAYTFTVMAAPLTTVATGATSYYQGDTISFSIVTTETSIGTIIVTVRDPTLVTWWTATGWPLTGVGIQSVLYQDQLINGNPLTLPSDAPLGSWNWTVTYTPASTGLPAKATGLFTVAAPPTMQTVLDQLDTLEATITGIVTDSEGDLTALINTKTGQITTKLDPLMPKLQGIEDTAVIIATMLGEVQVDIAALDLDALGVDITAIKGDVATIKTSIGTVTASVSALDAKVTTLSGNVATVSTTLGTLEGTVTSIDGTVATIDTDVGAIQADVTEILDKPDVDMTPVWIAVVLSLIAAIAAIFAVVTIRQKIAG